jgi:hypothetical protein
LLIYFFSLYHRSLLSQQGQYVWRTSIYSLLYAL